MGFHRIPQGIHRGARARGIPRGIQFSLEPQLVPSSQPGPLVVFLVVHTLGHFWLPFFKISHTHTAPPGIPFSFSPHLVASCPHPGAFFASFFQNMAHPHNTPGIPFSFSPHLVASCPAGTAGQAWAEILPLVFSLPGFLPRAVGQCARSARACVFVCKCT